MPQWGGVVTLRNKAQRGGVETLRGSGQIRAITALSSIHFSKADECVCVCDQDSCTMLWNKDLLWGEKNTNKWWGGLGGQRSVCVRGVFVASEESVASENCIADVGGVRLTLCWRLSIPAGYTSFSLPSSLSDTQTAECRAIPSPCHLSKGTGVRGVARQQFCL